MTRKIKTEREQNLKKLLKKKNEKNQQDLYKSTRYIHVHYP